MTSENLNKTIESFLEAKDKISELEKTVENARAEILKYMTDNMISTYEYKGKVIKKNTATRECLNKKDIPEEFWSKYCSTVKYDTLTITKKKTGR
jgi:hypothetical protein